MSPVSRATDIGRRDEEAREIRGSNPAYLPPSSMPVRLDNGHRQEIEDGKVIQKYARGSEILVPSRHGCDIFGQSCPSKLG